jgi:hypothetical protein
VDTAVTIDIFFPPDCGFPPGPVLGIPIFVAEMSISTTISIEPIGTEVVCSSPSFHEFSGRIRLDVVEAGTFDPNTDNNSMQDQDAVAVIGDADLKITSVSLDAPATAIVGQPFQIEVTAVAHNNGPFGPANADVFVELGVPDDCTMSPDQVQIRTGVPLIVSVSEPTVMEWTVTCTEPGEQEYAARAAAVLDELHVVDPTGTNNSAMGSTTVTKGEPEVTPTPTPPTTPTPTPTPEPPTPTPEPPTPTPTPTPEAPTPTPTPTALPEEQTPEPSPSPTALPDVFPPTGGGGSDGGAGMPWTLLVLAGAALIGVAHWFLRRDQRTSVRS